MGFYRPVAMQLALKQWEEKGGSLVICGECAAPLVLVKGAPWPVTCAECGAPFIHPAGGRLVHPPASPAG